MPVVPEIPLMAARETARWLATIPPFSSRPIDDWRVSQLASLTNRTFLVRSDDAAFVLRLPPSEGALSLDRRVEMHNLVIAAGLGLAPPVHHVDATSGALVTEYLAGSRPLDTQDFSDPRTQEKVGGVLHALQSSGAAFRGRQDPTAAIDAYLTIHADKTAVELRGALGPALEALARSAPAPVAAHVDPHPGNFLLRSDGSLGLIDWEFSALADPHWDVATVLNFMPGDEATLRRVAAIALKDVREPVLVRLRVFQVVLHLVAGSWAAMVAAARGDPGLAGLAASYLARCRDSLSQGKLDAWLKEIETAA